MDTPRWLPLYQTKIQDALLAFFQNRYLSDGDVSERTFEEAMLYAVDGAGKRIRPILTLLAYEHITKKPYPDELMNVLIGIECIHAFTLVHDDLPCMDNDELRRGKPTVWKKYGETIAVLVGDGLQTLGFACLASAGKMEIIESMAQTLGDFGITRGQVRDTLLRQDTLSLDELTRLHDEKTGGFIQFSLFAGAVLAGADSECTQHYTALGQLLGRAFQIQDDILDFEGDSVSVGKKTGKDVALGKGVVALLGIEGAKAFLRDLQGEISSLTEKIGDERIAEISHFISNRKG